MTPQHKNARLETFCDGVFAIALTLLILDVRVPSPQSITSSDELWGALQRLTPTIFAFGLSFGIIFITWVNHHATMQQVSGSSAPFIYANGFLLLTVVSLPFSAGLLGEFLGTDQAAPAVILYNAVLAVQALSWIALTSTALNDRLTADSTATAAIRVSQRNGYLAAAFYVLLAIAAAWFPLAVAIITTLSWTFWLVLSIRMKRGIRSLR
jgi:TMEM175 potassium channel family protein